MSVYGEATPFHHTRIKTSATVQVYITCTRKFTKERNLRDFSRVNLSALIPSIF
jgi:hypothetical protein